MRIALLVAFAYLVFVPFIINLVDSRPRSEFYKGEPRYRAGLRKFPTKGYVHRTKKVKGQDIPQVDEYGSPRLLLRRDHTGRIKPFHDKRYRYSYGELLPFFPSQVTCVFLITLAIWTGCKLKEASRHLAALQKIRDGQEASAGTS